MGFFVNHLLSGLIGVFLFLVFAAAPLWPQVNMVPGDGSAADPASFIGLTLTETIRRFGIPKSVYAVRGLEEWQDDVVFVYNEADFYIFKDRVWQAGLKEARGIKVGDPRAVIPLILGFSGAELRENSISYFLNEGAWPLMLRFDFDNAGMVRAIFIYRTDI